MRLLKRGDKAEPVAVRARRVRRLHKRIAQAVCVAVVLGAAGGSAWYLRMSGKGPAALAEIEARIATAGVELNLTVQSVEVEGRDRADRQAILNAVGVARGTPILGIDLDGAQARLETVPWIHTAAVERLLPDTIYVRLVEHRPLAVWQHRGKFDLIDQDGAIIPNARVEEFPALLQVVGDEAPRATADLLALIASEPDLASHVSAAVRVGGRRWNLALDNGVEVDLPETAADAAWHRLATLDRTDRVLERDIKAVDLRLPDRLVLRLPPDTAKTIINPKKNRPTSPNT